MQDCKDQIKLCGHVSRSALSLEKARMSTSLSEVTLRKAWQLSPKAGLSVSLQEGAVCHNSKGLLAAHDVPSRPVLLGEDHRDKGVLLSQCPQGTGPASRSPSFRNLSCG